MSNVRLLEDQGIDLKRKVEGHVNTTCPQCSHTRKKKKDPCLSVDITDGLYKCHHCNWSRHVFEKTVKEYARPVGRLEALGIKALHWFEHDRKISNNVLLRLKVTEATEWMPGPDKEVKAVCFNYYRGEELINIKFRRPQKSFKLAKDAELIFYNLNALEGWEWAVIVEGEIDCLTMHECGIYNSISTPNGAPPKPKDRPYSPKLEYLDNCWQELNRLSKVIIAVDDDEVGRLLRDELARRIGKEKCFTVTYPEGCKDANEVLINHGKDAVKQMIDNATAWPLEGIVPMEDMADELMEWFVNGYPTGAKAGIPGFDELLAFSPGELTMVTGIPGHGKDEFTNYIMASMTKNHLWKWGVFGFEEKPIVSASKLIEKYAGKSFAARNDCKQMPQDDMERGILFVHEYFSFVNIRKIQATMPGIIKKAIELVKRKGIKGVVINPWNCIEHHLPAGSTETLYTSEVLTELVAFAEDYGVHVILIAHPTKMYKDEKTGKYKVPTLYSISGSSNFFNKTYNGITIYRDETTEVYVQKVKQHWNGQTGWCSFRFNRTTRQYEYLTSSVSVNSSRQFDEGNGVDGETVQYSSTSDYEKD